jgi:hypothetical protein
MQWPFFLFTAIIAAIIFLQDLKERMVTWFLFPLLAISGIALSIIGESSLQLFLWNSVFNLSFIAIQLVLLELSFRLKKKVSVLVAGTYIGLGDILLIAACCFYFSPVNFILFYCLSLVFALLSHVVMHLIRPSANTNVPLAGLQAVFLVLFLSCCKIFDHNATSDDWFLYYASAL